MRTGTKEDYLTQIKEAVNENFPGEGDEEDEDFITEIPEKDKRKSLTKHGFFSNYMAVELLMGILAYYVICEIVLLIIGKKCGNISMLLVWRNGRRSRLKICRG